MRMALLPTRHPKDAVPVLTVTRYTAMPPPSKDTNAHNTTGSETTSVGLVVSLTHGTIRYNNISRRTTPLQDIFA